ncbi:MarR family winged helix-turn-helix transcriptional regulator [Microlunatus sp. Gsoil 973]|jgi:DNA-binding MarR family transcriptional regulator|uniref:MarR family winged helix-turn-helix transcriptional regulator n=1 Tax=Microlunatus sp. Gsoil 973 TaxID=2672569 RepID=UPI0012B4B73A|nr:MarR family transcriptional regulator [Microlunatus sp. Gsoil 973]QGN31601.1 MarR family transcriptional regulator [Microlunatus sp. Gsoil 973]
MSQTPWLNESEQRIWRTYLLGAAELWQRLDQALRPFNLSLNEYSILVCLSEGPDQRLRMSELADAVHQSRSRLTHTITRMEAAGLVRREASRSDRRGVWAELTQRGVELLQESAPAHVESVRRHLIGPAGPDDWEALGRVFDGLLDTPRDDGTLTPRHFILVAPTPTSDPDDEDVADDTDDAEDADDCLSEDPESPAASSGGYVRH